MLLCTKCVKELPDDAFPSGARRGLGYWCRSCVTNRAAERSQALHQGTEDFIYCLAEEGTHFFKVGKTNRRLGSVRLANARCGNPRELHLIWTCDTDKHVTEAAFHTELRRQGLHHDREWYQSDCDLMTLLDCVLRIIKPEETVHV